MNHCLFGRKETTIYHQKMCIRDRENIWYEGDNGSADHYNWTRYYALNLHSVFYRGDVYKRQITESGLDTRAMPAVFLGGGAALLKRNVSAADGLCRPVILDDVSLNAKGYERLAERLTKNDEQ